MGADDLTEKGMVLISKKNSFAPIENLGKNNLGKRIFGRRIFLENELEMNWKKKYNKKLWFLENLLGKIQGKYNFLLCLP